jgi:hypothetical protein
MASKYKKSHKSEDKLKLIKDNISSSYSYFADNYKSYRNYTYFTFVSNLSSQQASSLLSMSKAPLEFNIMEALVNKRLGEFSRSEQYIKVSATPTADISQNPALAQQVDITEAHLRYRLTGSYNNDMRYQIFKCMVSGGWGVGETYVDYVDENTFEKEIYNVAHPNPCLVFFDPNAKESHKGDGDYCGDINFVGEEELRRRFGDDKAEEIMASSYQPLSSAESGFGWDKLINGQPTWTIVRYFEKEYKRIRKVEVADNPITGSRHTMTAKAYEIMLAEWDSLHTFALPPEVIQSRWVIEETICEYTVAGCGVLEKKKTPYPWLPLVFFDGNSVFTSENELSLTQKQFTRPLTYQAKSTQKFLNSLGQTILLESDSLLQSDIMMSKESIASEYFEDWKKPQQNRVLIYNGFVEGDPEKQAPPPREVIRPQLPAFIPQMFSYAPTLMQIVLGSYGAQEAIQSDDPSGVAIQHGAVQSSLISEPYSVGFSAGLTRMANLNLKLMPEVYGTPRVIPIQMNDGSIKNLGINGAPNPQSVQAPNQMQQPQQAPGEQPLPEGVKINFKPTDMVVQIEPGPSVGVQKEMMLKQMIAMGQFLPSVAQFWNENPELFFENMEGIGVDRMISKFEEFKKANAEQQAQQQQMVQQRQMLELQNMDAVNKKLIAESQAKISDAETNARKVDNQESQFVAGYIQEDSKQAKEHQIKVAQVLEKNRETHLEAEIKQAELLNETIGHMMKNKEINAENKRTEVDLAIAHSSHIMDIDKHHHQKNMEQEGLALEKDKHEHQKKMDKKTGEKNNGESQV